jgi:hypothetical protein
VEIVLLGSLDTTQMDSKRIFIFVHQKKLRIAILRPCYLLQSHEQTTPIAFQAGYNEFFYKV